MVMSGWAGERGLLHLLYERIVSLVVEEVDGVALV